MALHARSPPIAAMRPSRPAQDPGGQLIVSKNAVKHGLFADGLFLDLDRQAFAQFQSGIFDELCPAGHIERDLAERIACQMWRLKRIPQLEAGAHLWRQHGTEWGSVVGFNETEFRAKVAKASETQFQPLIEAALDYERPTLYLHREQQTERNIENGLATFEPPPSSPGSSLRRPLRV